jgi:DUF4097 and DUF4098 domain-containing protein YvlB
MNRRYGSVFWSLILISIGLLFLLSNLKIVLHPWALIGRYWPILIILWGLSKLIYFFQSPADPEMARRSRLGGGDIVLLVFLLLVGSVVSKATQVNWPWPSIHEWETRSGDQDWGMDSRKNFNYTEDASLAITGKENALEIQNSYGNVDVNVHDLPQIKVKLEKRIRVDDEKKAGEINGQIKLKLQKSGNGFFVGTNREDLDEESRRGLKTNLEVWIPRKMTVKLTNQYGDVSLTAIDGNHSLSNQYGSLNVKNVDGTLQAENKYGGINVFGVTGDCSVTDKYAGIELENVGGKVTVDGGYGGVSLKKIKGDVKVTHKNGSLDCEDLGGSLDVDGRFVQVKSSSVMRDVHVVTSYRGIELENVQGTLSIEGKHGDIEIRNQQPPTKPIKINSEYSSVTLTLPPASQFKFEGFSRFGKLESTFDDIKAGDFGRENRIIAQQGKSGPLIAVNTSYRDIHLNAE